MIKSRIIALYDQDQRKNVTYPGMRREVIGDIVRHLDTSEGGEGIITYSRLNESDLESTIHEQVSFFESIGQDLEWKIYDYDNPPNLREKLNSYGFTVEEPEAVMVMDLEATPDVLWEPVVHNIQRIVNPAKLTDVATVEQQVWNEDSSWVLHFLGDILNNYPDLISVYVAYVDNHPASAAWTFFQKQSRFASLWGGATISHFRKQGLYTALLAVRAQEAKARQIRYVTTDASPMSRPILTKLGFEMIAYTYPCKWSNNIKKL